MKILSMKKTDLKYFSAFIKFNLISHKICSETCIEKCYISIFIIFETKDMWRYRFFDRTKLRDTTWLYVLNLTRLNINYTIFKTKLTLIFLIKRAQETTRD